MYSAINSCLEKTSEENIVVDTILTSSHVLRQVDPSELNSVEMMYRFLEINFYYHSMDGILRSKFAYPKVQFRYSVSPT